MTTITTTQNRGVVVLEEPIILTRGDVRPTKTGNGYYTSLRIESTGVIKHPDGSATRVRLSGWWNPTIRAILDAE